MALKPLECVSFDEYAKIYDAALQQGLAVSGEDKNHFANGRVAWLADCLRSSRYSPRRALDFGCGTGTSVPLLFEHLGVESVIGVDTSRESIEVADREFGSDRARFYHCDDYSPAGDANLAFCNGVFHHIPPADRAEAVSYVYRALRPGGLFAFWENNPLNPGTRYVMSRIPFDRDAITLTAGEAKAMLQASGFRVRSVHYLFIFPRLLKWLRVLEPAVCRLPFGAQYQIIAEKP